MSLLGIKLYIPPSRPGLIPRPHLVRCLNEGLSRGCRLTLVSAPAGFGKTTLVLEWLNGWRADAQSQAVSRRIGWLSLDEGDNETARFLTYLVAALQRIDPRIGSTLPNLLESSAIPAIDVFMTTLINDLAAAAGPLVLVLDGYQAIDGPDVHRAVAFMLDHQPQQMHLVLVTRGDPPLPLARYRAQGLVAEIRERDLRFDRQEAAAFLKQTMGLDLASGEMDVLVDKTEGWIAGLQMAALSLQGRDDVQGFISTFTGRNRYVMDYLAQEVLNRQPQALQDFILRTSILERLTGELCDALTGGTDGSTVLESLDRANLFVVPLDNDRLWYRYHHLFADLVHSRLLYACPEIVPELHLNASRWFAAHGFMDEAIGHALAAGKVEHAAQLIEQAAPALSRQGRIETLSRWIGALPEAIVARRPQLGYALAWALYMAYRFEQCEILVQQIEQHMSPADAASLQGERALWHGIFARRHGNLAQSQEFLLQALDQLPAADLTLRGRAWVFYGLGYMESDIQRARAAFVQASEHMERQNSVSGMLSALYFLSRNQILAGTLVQAALTSDRALRLAGQVPNWPAAGYAHLAAAGVFYERGDLEQAGQHAARGIELSELGGHTDNLLIAVLDAARVQRGCGNWAQAHELLARVEDLARSTIPWMRLQVLDEQICLLLAQGKSYEASEWFHAGQTGLRPGAPIPELHEQMIAARVQIARRHAREALARLPALLEQAATLGLLRWATRIHCMQALAFQDLGLSGRACDELRAALALAEPEGSIQVFVDEGPPMRDLLSQALEPDQPFVFRLRAAFARQGAGEAAAQPAIPEMLSKREIELLRLIAEGRTNKEIAAELVIALGTVKRHTVNIFDKLDVKNRTEAVAKARELGLL